MKIIINGNLNLIVENFYFAHLAECIDGNSYQHILWRKVWQTHARLLLVAGGCGFVLDDQKVSGKVWSGTKIKR